ncbi:MAG: AAA family ATPase [Thermoanaerobaculia bacterium]
MRISRLDLKRYGKFTDRSISMPAVTRDFHLILGANEAGKSTLRDAVKDLLFGIETRSRYNFLHPHSEMCLGALVEHGDESLDFVRTKARTRTLQTSKGVALPDGAMMPFLGQVDRTFFDQMFGLDHERLVRGGQEILSASNDIGQILFQAAAGIGGLGQVRDRLEAEADKLWAKRKSGEREYYIASAELEQAEAELKQVTVRTRDWQEARAQVDRLKEEMSQARGRFDAAEQERVRLERVRRVAPMLIRLSELDRHMADLGQVIALPEAAAHQLEGAEREIAIAEQSLTLFERQSAELQEKIDKLHPDESLLLRASDIDSLSELRQQLRNHEGDIGKREEEIRVLWQTVRASARQLGWPEETEEDFAQRLPSSLVQSALDSLIHRHEALEQALTAAEESRRSKEEEIKGINAEIAALPPNENPVSLRDALATARALGDVVAQEKKGATQVARLNRDLEAASLELGRWGASPEDLRQIALPPAEETNRLVTQRGELEVAASTIRERLADAVAHGEVLQLEISQYKAAHQPVTLVDVQQSRTVRDTTWQAMKSGVSNSSLNSPLCGG